MFVAERRRSRTVTLTRTSLRKLRKRLPRGYQGKAVAELNGKYSQSYVSLVASGKRNNTEVIAALIRVAEQEHAERRRLEDAINSL